MRALALIHIPICLLLPSLVNAEFAARLDLAACTGILDVFSLLHRDAHKWVFGTSDAFVFVTSNSPSCESIELIKWRIDEANRQQCLDQGGSFKDCSNAITLYADLPRRGGGGGGGGEGGGGAGGAGGEEYVVCGTQGMTPTCARFSRGSDTPYLVSPERALAGPPKTTAPFMASERWLIVASTSTDKEDGTLYRRPVAEVATEKCSGLSTGLSSDLFDQPRFAAVTRDIDVNELFVWSSETPVGDGPIDKDSAPMLTRACIDESGGAGNYRGEWTSLAKARLKCASGYYNTIVHVSSSELNYVVTFSAGEGGRARAVCLFNRATLRHVIREAFSGRRSDGGCPRDFTSSQIAARRTQPFITHPLVGKVVSTVDSVAAAVSDDHHVYALTNQSQIVTFVHPRKSREWKEVQRRTFESDLKSSVTMWLNESDLIVFTGSKLLSETVRPCNFTDCEKCVMDHTCVWDTTLEECASQEDQQLLAEERFLTDEEMCTKKQSYPLNRAQKPATRKPEAPADSTQRTAYLRMGIIAILVTVFVLIIATILLKRKTRSLKAARRTMELDMLHPSTPTSTHTTTSQFSDPE